MGWYVLAGYFLGGPCAWVAMVLWQRNVAEPRARAHAEGLEAEARQATDEWEQERKARQDKAYKQDTDRWDDIATEVRRTEQCHLTEVQAKLDALEYPMQAQVWRDMELTFYAFRERLQGKPVKYLDNDVDAPPPSAEFMAKLEARLNPGQSKSSGTG